MARRIKYRAQCYYCKKWCEPNKAFLQRVEGKWFCQCDDCYKTRQR